MNHAATRGGQPGRLRLLLVERYRLIGEALAIVLRSDAAIEVVGVETDADLALARARSVRPDVAMVDHVPGFLDGPRAASALRDEVPGLKVLVVALAVDEELARACVLAGATGCLTRERAVAELAESVKRVHAGEVLFEPWMPSGCSAADAGDWPTDRRGRLGAPWGRGSWRCSRPRRAAGPPTRSPPGRGSPPTPCGPISGARWPSSRRGPRSRR